MKFLRAFQFSSIINPKCENSTCIKLFNQIHIKPDKEEPQEKLMTLLSRTTSDEEDPGISFVKI